MRLILSRLRPDVRPRRLPISHLEVEQARLRAMREANLPRMFV